MHVCIARLQARRLLHRVGFRDTCTLYGNVCLPHMYHVADPGSIHGERSNRKFT